MKCPHKENGRCKSCSNRDRKGKYKWSPNAILKRKGSRNPNWKGKYVTCSALHEWIRNNFFKKDRDVCEDCGTNKNLDMANISGKYKRNIDDWKILCRSCHMKLDYKLGNRKSQRVKNG